MFNHQGKISGNVATQHHELNIIPWESRSSEEKCTASVGLGMGEFSLSLGTGTVRALNVSVLPHACHFSQAWLGRVQMAALRGS